MQARTKPTHPIIRPLSTLLAVREAIIVRPNRAIINRSWGPNWNANRARGGARNSSAMTLRMPPQKEEIADSTNASCGFPFSVIAYPSIAVAAAALVPGVLIKMAEMEPPNMEPQ